MRFSPGSYAEEEIVARDMTFLSFQHAMGFGHYEMRAFFHGQLEVDRKLAKKLSELFGTSVNLWIELEKEYRRDKAPVTPVAPANSGAAIGASRGSGASVAQSEPESNGL